MKLTVLISAALAAATFAPAALRAQNYNPPKGSPADTAKQLQIQTASSIGYPHFGFQGDYAGTARWGFGGRFESGLTRVFPGLPSYRLIGGFDYFPGSRSNNWEVNTNAIDLFPVRNMRANSYLGTGLNIAHNSPSIGTGHTSVGVNLLAGLRFAGANSPFLETRLELGGGNQFLVTLGYMFR